MIRINKYVAVKVLTSRTTRMYDGGYTWQAESTAHRLLTYPPLSKHCVHQLDRFRIEGLKSGGPHLCFVLPLYGGNVQSLIASYTSVPENS